MLYKSMTQFLIKSIPASNLADYFEDDSGSIIVDVREKEEFEQWSIKNALNIPLRQLTDNLDKIPIDRKVLVICASGNRSSYGCQLLNSLGYDAINVDGGMSAWGAGKTSSNTGRAQRGRNNSRTSENEVRDENLEKGESR